MSSSPFRNWRRASRKSSIPFFPGAWPNSSAHDSIVTKSEREAVDAQELSDTAIGDHVAQLGQGTSSLPSGSSRSEASHYRSEAIHRKSDEPLLQHIDHVTDFHRRLSHSLNYSQSGSIGSIPTEVDLQMVSSRTDTFSSSSGTTIATPGPLSPATSLSFPLLVSTNANNHRKKSFSLPRIMTQHSTSSNPIENSISTRTSAQLDSPLQSYGHGLPPLSLPPHTLSFSPQSVASYFSSSDQSRKTADTNMSPPLPPSPPTSTIPASFIIPSPVHQDYASLPEIPSSSGFATSFYPVLDSRHENHTPGIHDMLSVAPSGSSRVYGDDSPVLPSDEEINPKFLSPLMSPYQREGLSPSSAEMDAFGLAAEHIPHDARSDISIPTSLRSQFVAEPGIRDSTFDDADDTLRPDVYANRSRSPSLSLSLSSIESLNLDPRFTYTHDFELRRNKRRSEPPLSAPVISPDVPVVTTVTSSALSVHATSPNDKPSGLDKVKKFGGKLKKLFSFKGKAMASEGPIPGIGVNRSTQVTNVEYASEHPIPLGETKRTKPNPVPSPSRAGRSRRQSLPVLSMSGSSVTVSRPKPLRPASFLAMDPAESSSYGLLSSSKLADLQHALGSKVGSKSSIHFSRTRASTNGSKQPSSPAQNPRGQGVEKPLPPTPVTPARERRRSEFVTPTARPAISPGKLRRFSMSPGFGASRIDMLKPHPPLPQKGDVPRLSQETAGGLISGMTQKKKQTTSSRMVKARSMVVGHVYHRKPVPIIDDTDLRKDMVAQDPKPELVPTTGLAAVDSSSPLGQKDFKGVDPPSFLAEPPVLHRSLPITERSVEQKSNKRRSRGFSFTSTVSKRAQKARSMIVGCPDRNAAIVGPANGIQYHRTDTSETRGSSLGCADYEPDLVPDNMSFAPRPGLRSGSSAISVDEVTLDQNSSSGRTTRAMSSQSLIGNTEAEDSLFDISDPMVIANAIRRAEEPGADETTMGDPVMKRDRK